MDAFYIKNATLYNKLLAQVDPSAPKAHFSRHTTSTTTQTQTEKKSVKQRCPSSITVAARIRPMAEEDVRAGFPCAAFTRKGGEGIVDLHDLYNHPTRQPVIKSSEHTVDYVFGPESTTEKLFNDLVVPLMDFAKRGGVGTLFAYGQTGSGKTYTISELQRLVSAPLLEHAQESGQQLSITYFDLAGNSAYDLLNERKPFSVLEDGEGDIHLSGALEKVVSTQEEMMELIEIAMANRPTASTTKNDTSSRSHSICRLRIQQGPQASSSDGLLYLIDLAGSEAARDIFTHSASRMKETREINVSLSVLKDCIRGKAEAESLKAAGDMKALRRIRIPIRSSVLTKCLKHVFEGEGRTVVVACVNPSLADCGPGRNTLRYAELLRGTGVGVKVKRTRSPPGGVLESKESSGRDEMQNGMVRVDAVCGTEKVSREEQRRVDERQRELDMLES